MNSRHHITSLLKEWLELTHRESRAIQIGRWSDLVGIQKTKTDLIQPLTTAIERWKTDNRDDTAVNLFSGGINQLLALEARNSQLLAVRKREVREKILLLEQILFDLCHFKSVASPMRAAA